MKITSKKSTNLELFNVFFAVDFVIKLEQNLSNITPLSEKLFRNKQFPTCNQITCFSRSTFSLFLDLKGL